MPTTYGGRNKPICTWLSKEELELFRAIARSNNVSRAAYLRAMIVDVLAEEGPKVTVPRRSLPPDIFAAFRAKLRPQRVFLAPTAATVSSDELECRTA